MVFLQDDDEGHLTAFHCVEDLLSKGRDIFLVQFVRLGVLNRIKDINDTYEKEDFDKSDQNPGTVCRSFYFLSLFFRFCFSGLSTQIVSIVLSL